MNIGLCHGVFDLLHFGHIRHLRTAREMCDRLVVSVTADRFVNKGPTRPVFPLEYRMEVIEALSIVDEVVPSDAPSAVPNLQRLKPRYYFKHVEYKNSTHPGFLAEAAHCEQNGISLVFTEGEQGSSTAALQRFLLAFK